MWFSYHVQYNSKVGECVKLIYPIEFEIKDTVDKVKSASYLDSYLETDRKGLNLMAQGIIDKGLCVLNFCCFFVVEVLHFSYPL